MFARRPWLRASVTLAALNGMLFMPSAPRVLGAEPSAEAARLETYDKLAGESYFALSLTAMIDADRAAAHEITLLFDTSASQAGDYRVKALESLEALLGALGPDDRVRLVAVDVNAVPLTEGFVAAQGDEIDAALARLRARVPLGATDMAAALDAILPGYAASSDAGRAAIYIGDGMSLGGGLDAATLERIVTDLVQARVPVSSLAIGPRFDASLLAALANHTGGMLAVDGDELTAFEEGRFLAAAAREVVAWPTAAQWPAAFTAVYPKMVPPLRADRDIVVVGQGQLDAAAEVTIAAEVAGRSVDFQWTVAPAASSDENAYLAQVVDLARGSDGIGLPTVGTAGLKETRVLFRLAAQQLAHLGGQAVALGNFAEAERLAAAAEEIDPQVAGAAFVRQAARNGAEDLRLVADEALADEGAAADEGDPLAGDGGLIDQFEQERRVRAEQIQADVLDVINKARANVRRDPEGVIEQLKLTREMVQAAPDLTAEQRAQLLDQLGSALQVASGEKTVAEQQRAARADRDARERAEQRAIEDTYINEQRVEQLMARFDALMAEEHYADAEAVAFIARDLKPDSDTTNSAVVLARTVGYIDEAYALREARHRGMVDMLSSVERSFVPQSDEPPIVYPDPEVWQALTERRKKYEQIDLAGTSEKERKIQLALEEETSLDFIETPLTDVLAYLSNKHEIQIYIDDAALEETGVTSDTPITVSLTGITLRSALKLMLEPHELAYLIEDEVLKITTQDRADNTVITKVYPVADLVLPIPDTGSSGGLGGIGGFGQGLGGGGGGGMQGGGGGFGGGGGGGGQGFFDVKDDLRLTDDAAGAAPAEAVAVAAPQPKRPAKVKAIRVKVQEGSTPAKAWERYFATHQEDDRRPTPAAVRETVRRYRADEQWDHVLAICQAALRHGQGQPWMYEIMGLAWQVQGLRGEEIERALLSAADLSASPLDLLYVAFYLSRAGYDAPALRLFRQAAALEPLRPEPYLHGMAAARRLKDLEGVRWATLGVLRQAWPEDQVEYWHQADRLALATVEELKADGRTDEADQFQQQIDQAKRRDLAIVVTWTGEADVDLSVEEPTGAVCSLRHARTNGGGVLVGDSFQTDLGESGLGTSEVYVCPEGFDGAYRLLLRRIWGRIPAGKVTVDVYTHIGTPEAKRLRKQVPLGEKDALVAFDLQGGRRREVLAQRQLQAAAADQAALMAVRHDMLLRRQLAALADTDSLRDLLRSRGRGSLARRALGRREAVGFMPIIIFLPEGANLQVQQAIVSPDRRYVRVTPAPFFSAITQVDTFTFDGLAPNSQGQGGGGGGGLF